MSTLDDTIAEVKAFQEADRPMWRIMYHKGEVPGRWSKGETFVAQLGYWDYHDYPEESYGFVNDTKYETEEYAEQDRLVSHIYDRHTKA